MRKLAPAESDVQRAAIELLHWSPVVTGWRNNVGGARPQDTKVMNECLGMLQRGESPEKVVARLRSYGKKRGQSVRFGVPGASDWLGYFTSRSRHVRPGTICALEFKRPGGSLTNDQGKFLTAISAAGGVAAKIDDVDVLDAVLRGAHCDPKIDEPPF
jgi:hypothetical protein